MMSDFVECQICHKKMHVINNWHLKTHDLTLDKYKKMYPGFDTCSDTSKYKMGSSTRGKNRDQFKQKITGKNNGMFGKQHSKVSILKMSLNRKCKGKGICGKYERTQEIKNKISQGVSRFIQEYGLSKTRYSFDLTSNSKHYFGRRGIYRSRTGITSNYRSSWELSVMIFFDIHPEVEYWCYEPFSIIYNYFGRNRSYTPDFYVDFSGVKEIWEVKPEVQVCHCEITWAKLYALEDAKVAGYNFHQISVLTEKEIENIRNIDWHSLYSRYGFTKEELETRKKEMAENVRIDDILYRGEK